MRLGQGIRLSSGGFLVSSTAELPQQNNAQSPPNPELTAELQPRWRGRGEALAQLCCACLQGPRGKVIAHTGSSSESSLCALRAGRHRGFSWNASPLLTPRLPVPGSGQEPLCAGSVPLAAFWCGWGWSWRPGRCENTPGNAQGV